MGVYSSGYPVVIKRVTPALEDVLRQVFLPALRGQPAPNDVTCNLLALPYRLGGMNIVNPTTMFKRQYTASTEICMPIVNIIQEKSGNVLSARIEQQVIKHHIHQCRRKELNDMPESIMNALPSELRARLRLKRKECRHGYPHCQ